MKQKRNDGITLIALVITIIVLLILAGVTINMVLGDDGIIYQAQQARNKQEEKEQEEKEEIQIGEYKIAQYTEGTIAKKLKVGDYVEYTYKNENGTEESVICIVINNNETEGIQILPTTTTGTITIGSTDLEEAKNIAKNLTEILNDEAEKYVNKDLALTGSCITLEVCKKMTLADPDGTKLTDLTGCVTNCLYDYNVDLTEGAYACILVYDNPGNGFGWTVTNEILLWTQEGGEVNSSTRFAPIIKLIPSVVITGTATDENGRTYYTIDNK